MVVLPQTLRAELNPATLLTRSRESVRYRPETFDATFVYGRWASRQGALGGYGTNTAGIEAFLPIAKLFMTESRLADDPALLTEFPVRGTIKCSPKVACLEAFYDVLLKREQKSMRRQVTAWWLGDAVGKWYFMEHRVGKLQVLPDLYGSGIAAVSHPFVSDITQVVPVDFGGARFLWQEAGERWVGPNLAEKSFAAGIPWREAAVAPGSWHTRMFVATEDPAGRSDIEVVGLKYYEGGTKEPYEVGAPLLTYMALLDWKDIPNPHGGPPVRKPTRALTGFFVFPKSAADAPGAMFDLRNMQHGSLSVWAFPNMSIPAKLTDDEVLPKPMSEYYNYLEGERITSLNYEWWDYTPSQAFALIPGGEKVFDPPRGVARRSGAGGAATPPAGNRARRFLAAGGVLALAALGVWWARRAK